MNQNLTKKQILILSVFIFFLGIVFTITCVYIIEENSKCSKSPFIYGTKLLEKKGYTSLCSCDIMGDKLKTSVTVWFDSEKMYDRNPLIQEYNIMNTKEFKEMTFNNSNK